MAESDKALSVDSRLSGSNYRRERSEQFESEAERHDALTLPNQRTALESLDDQLRRAGRDDPNDRYAEAVRMVQSAEPTSLKKTTLHEGDHVYAFTSRPTEAQGAAWNSAYGKQEQSTYYMTEQEYRKTLAECRTGDGKLDGDQVKSRFALPCENKCDQVVKRRVDQTHEAWESTCCPTAEQVRAFDGHREYTYERTMAGGGQQIFAMNNQLGPRQEEQQSLELTPYHNQRVDLDTNLAAQRTAAEHARSAELAPGEASKDQDHANDDGKQK